MCAVINPLGDVEPYVTEGVGLGFDHRINNLASQYRTRIDHQGNVVRIRNFNPRGRDGINHIHNRAITNEITPIQNAQRTTNRALTGVGWLLDFGGGWCNDEPIGDAALHATGRSTAGFIGGKFGGPIGAILGPMIYDVIFDQQSEEDRQRLQEQREIRQEGWRRLNEEHPNWSR